MIDTARRQLIDNIRISIAEHHNETDILRSAVELIDAFSENFNWTGVYMMKDNLLHVGPYIGPKTEHTRIELNSGICGAAASKKKTVVVDNVREDPRFIACSRTTRSEIVVPLLDGDAVLGEIDIDSDRPANFTGQDQQMLEEIADILVQRLKDIQ
ncbi:MAG: GAF domain-containing protein [Candidatus Zixiibacteriota bacterium]|nr:MAG: GAF domain-containing protein [candidate division Zixibacteria bacterium]